MPRRHTRHSTRESVELRPSFPLPVIWIVVCILLENIAFYCVSGILLTYLHKDLRAVDKETDNFHHIFILMTYAFALLGGWMADALFSRRYMIIFALCAYTIFYVCITICSKNFKGEKETIHLFFMRKAAQTFFLFMVTFANGVFRPNIIAFAADQFELPEQEGSFGIIIALIYFISVIGKFGYALNSISCIFENQCYTELFGSLVVFLGISLILFLWTLKKCRRRKMETGFVWDLISSIFYAIHKKIKIPDQDYNHWLDRSRHSYGSRIVRYAKRTMRMLVIYMTLPVFFFLFQLSDRWPDTSYRMFGGSGENYTDPAIMKVVKICITVILIPIFYCLVYPVLSPNVRLLRRPLRRMICGGFIAVLAFVIAAIVYLNVESYEPEIPEHDEAHLRIYDYTNCGYRFWSTNPNIPSDTKIDEYYINTKIKASFLPKETNFTFRSYQNCQERQFTVDIEQKKAFGIFLIDNDINLFIDFIGRSKDGLPLVRTIISDENYTVVEYRHTVKEVSKYSIIGDLLKFPEVGTYQVVLLPWSRIEMEMGATYTVLINLKQRKIRPIIVTNPNKVHMLWQVPQYIIISIAEIMLWISGFEFAYTEAPGSSKALMLGLFIFFSHFLGTGINILIKEESLVFQKESTNCFIFALLLLVTSIIFAFLAHRYNYADDDEE